MFLKVLTTRVLLMSTGFKNNRSMEMAKEPLYVNNNNHVEN